MRGCVAVAVVLQLCAAVIFVANDLLICQNVLLKINQMLFSVAKWNAIVKAEKLK